MEYVDMLHMNTIDICIYDDLMEQCTDISSTMHNAMGDQDSHRSTLQFSMDASSGDLDNNSRCQMCIRESYTGSTVS